MRTCVGCRRAAPQAELVRVAVTAGGGLALGRELPGRGAWLCADGARPATACLDLAERRRAFGRALRTEVPPSAVASLRDRAGNARG